jgi:hypothetical protein
MQHVVGEMHFQRRFLLQHSKATKEIKDTESKI